MVFELRNKKHPHTTLRKKLDWKDVLFFKKKGQRPSSLTWRVFLITFTIYGVSQNNCAVLEK